MKNKIEALADTIVNYSLNIKENDKVLITTSSLDTRDLIMSLIEKIKSKRAVCKVEINDPVIASFLNSSITENRIKLIKDTLNFNVSNYDAFINIKYNENDYENKLIDKESLKKLREKTKKENDIKINKRRWVLLNYPSKLDAHKAHMTTNEYRDFTLDVMNVDYEKMATDLKALKDLMDKTDKVKIIGPNTDISFSIKNIKSVICAGEKNIPDGEVYTAPIKNSVNGTITYNTPSPYDGNIYTNVSLTFKDGKIIKATCNENNERLNEIFSTDEGSRYVGEFSLGVNPKINHPIGDILYDEKIFGSLHFTPGRCYKDADNKNISGIHWDLVLIQTKEYGGGSIYFDDVLIRKDGIFVIDELKHLNYGRDK